jgi:hypothetical protein
MYKVVLIDGQITLITAIMGSNNCGIITEADIEELNDEKNQFNFDVLWNNNITYGEIAGMYYNYIRNYDKQR